jgi:uracil-DNA glycosylase family 4
MISIKKSFADCMSCSLLNEPSSILETNCKDLEDVDIIFISDYPIKDEIKKEVPLIGKAGKIFRKYFEKYKINKMKYLLTHAVLCQPLDLENVEWEMDTTVIDKCKENCFSIIKACNPKLIVLMGDFPSKESFKIIPINSSITNMRGNFFKWEGYDVLTTVHPSFLVKQKSFEEKFEDDIKKAAEFITGENSVNEVKKINTMGKEGAHFYKIPDKFYTDEYRLIDIQQLHRTNEVLYIFRDKSGNKIYHKENDDYVCYQPKDGVDNRKTLSYNDVKQVTVKNKEKAILDHTITYDGDLRLTVKHAHDYYAQSKGEANVDLKIMFTDIETLTESKSFSPPEEANDMIVMLTYHCDKKYVTYVVDNKILLKNKDAEDITEEAIICKSEKELLSRFITDLKKLEIDVLTGWNSNNFDIPYIVNRAAKCGIDPSSISKYGEVNVDPVRRYCDITGIACLDMLELYKNYSQKKPENNRLGTVGLFELGQDKLDSGSRFAEMYKEDINLSIRYNVRDVSLLVDLDKKLIHIRLMNELREITRTTFQGASGQMGLVDSLIVSSLKSKGLVCRNADIHSKASKFEGAFVKSPLLGLHELIADLDFTGLYPSIIATLNIGTNTFVMKFKEQTDGYDYLYNFKNLPDMVEMIMDPDHANTEVFVNKNDLRNNQNINNYIISINGCFYKPHTELSYYSEILEHLLKSRKIYKNKMFDAKQAGDVEGQSLYDIRQLVYKVLANSIYGVLGNAAFRFFNLDMAKSITLTGQEFIKTSILEANSFVEALKTKKYVKPEMLTKQEMYGDLTRNTSYVITGDTDSLFATFGNVIDKKLSDEEKIKEVLDQCVILQKFLNKDIIEALAIKHGVPTEKNKLDLKNELVIKRGLFVSKKHYALHVVSQEGRECDEIVCKGLDVRRSDFSKYTKECLNELIDLILKSEKISPNKLVEFVKFKEKEFMRRILSGDKTIAKPASFTKDIEDYKRVSQNVVSMLNWNKLEYDIFAQGSKGYLFKIVGIKQDAPKEVIEKFDKEFRSKGEKLEVIGLPDEETSLPPYYIIDGKAMYKFAWEDRYKLLLDPILGRESQILTF